MKKRLKYLSIIGGGIIAALQLQAQGYIVPNGVTYAGIFLGPGYGINVVHNPTNFESTGFDLMPLGKTQPTIYTNTFQFDAIVDVSVRVFMVASNTQISVQPILSQSWTELVLNQNGYVFSNGVSFYLALYTGNQNNYPPNGIYTDPLFGWVQLVNNRGVIEMLGGAIEYGGAGIYAGTQNIIQAVPEPGTLALTALGGLLLGCRRWKP
jgi:hypothetical protein